MKSLISRLSGLVLIAISTDFAARAIRLLLQERGGQWVWCIQYKYDPVFYLTGSVFFDAVALIAIGPFVEELIFRYFGFKSIRYLSPRISSVYIILLTSIAFSFSHDQYWSDGVKWPALAGIFLLGLVYGGAFLARGKLVDSFVVHAVSNLIVWLSTEGTIFYRNYCVPLKGWVGWVELSLVLVLAAFAALTLMLGLRKRARQEMQPATNSFNG